jgi:hypothetical protein
MENVEPSDVEDAVAAEPPVVRLPRGGHRRVADARQQALYHRQRQTGASLAVGAWREAPAREVAHFAARHVAVHDLLDEQRNGGGGVQLAVAPRVADLDAHLLDDRGPQRPQRVLFDPRDRCGDTCHPWPPVGWWTQHLPF